MNILLADDHPFYLEALERQLSKAFRGAEVRGFPSLDGLCAALNETSADLVLLDFAMANMQGGESVRRVVALAGQAPVIVVSGVANAADVRACVGAGARGYLPKTMLPRLFIDAVSLILHGGTYLPAEMLTPPVAVPSPQTPAKPADAPPGIDGRDHELLRMLADGLSNKEIALKMDVQEATVKFYVSRLFRRLGVKNRSQAVSWAAKSEAAI